jgi:hypothetical protein
MKSPALLPALLLAVIALNAAAAPAPPTPHPKPRPRPFAGARMSDLSAHPAEAPAIRDMVAMGVMQPASPGRFMPDAPTTRGELATSVQRLFDLKPPAQQAHYTDVPANSPIYDAVQAVSPYLGRELLCQGCSLGSNFRPNAPVSQIESTILLTNVLRSQNRIALLSPAEAEPILAATPGAQGLRGPLRLYLASAIKAGVVQPGEATPGAMATVHTHARAAVLFDRCRRSFGLQARHPVN